MNILYYDFGISIEHALRLANGGKNHVWFQTDWASGLPMFMDYAPGLGFEKEGVEKIKYFFDYVDKADLIVFTANGAGDLCNFLRKITDTPIFGAGLGEKLENNRLKMRQIQKKVGLPVQNTEVIKGIPALREYLKNNPNKVVKIDMFRGDLETLVVKNYDSVKIVIDKLEFSLGGYADKYEFMVEDFIEGVETGYNAFFNGEEYVGPFMWTWVTDGGVTFSKYVEKLPEPIQKVADALAPVLKKLNYRGMVCTEVRITEDGTPYLIDICGRFSYPESLGFLDSIKNFPEVIYGIAKGEKPKIETAGKYFIMAPIESPEAKESWLQVDIDPKYKKYIKLYEAAKSDDKYFSIKGAGFIAAITVQGDDIDKLIKATKLISKGIHAYKMDLVNIETLEKQKEDIANKKAKGLPNFFD